MRSITEPALPPIHYATPEETRQHFDATARELLGINREEFLRRLDAGEYDDIIDDPAYHRTVGYLWDLSVVAR